MSLQLLLENAIKQKLIDKSSPLFIDVYCQDYFLVVKNNYQHKLYKSRSTGKGLTNLSKRYTMICKTSPHSELKTINIWHVFLF